MFIRSLSYPFFLMGRFGEAASAEELKKAHGQPGHTEVRWRPAQETSLAPRTKVFWEQMYCIEESTRDIVGTSRHRQ